MQTLDVIFDLFEWLQQDNRWDSIDYLFTKINVKNYSETDLLGFLCITNVANRNGKLKEYSNFRDRAIKEFYKRGLTHEDVTECFKGL